MSKFFNKDNTEININYIGYPWYLGVLSHTVNGAQVFYIPLGNKSDAVDRIKFIKAYGFFYRFSSMITLEYTFSDKNPSLLVSDGWIHVFPHNALAISLHQFEPRMTVSIPNLVPKGN